MEPNSAFRIEHPVLGRLCGLVWDIVVTIVTVLLIPLVCLASAASFVETSPMLAICTLPLAFVAVVSFAVGFVWNFRRHLPDEG